MNFWLFFGKFEINNLLLINFDTNINYIAYLVLQLKIHKALLVGISTSLPAGATQALC